MNKRKLHQGVRLTVDQLRYLKTLGKPSEWILEAVDEKKLEELTRNKK
ncbi:MAG: hypothetical protein ACOWW1_09170 [archaeon]